MPLFPHLLRSHFPLSVSNTASASRKSEGSKGWLLARYRAVEALGPDARLFLQLAHFAATWFEKNNQGLILIPGSVRPARLSCHVYTIRCITVIVEITAIT